MSRSSWKLNWIQILLLFIVAFYFIIGLLSNCIFLNVKYQDRSACISWELSNAIFLGMNKTTEVVQNKMENNVDRIQRGLSWTVVTMTWAASK